MIVHEFFGEDGIKAQVLFEDKTGFGVQYWRPNDTCLTEWYPGKSEAWAESAAENYVLGIKTIPTNDLKKALVE